MKFSNNTKWILFIIISPFIIWAFSIFFIPSKKDVATGKHKFLSEMAKDDIKRIVIYRHSNDNEQSYKINIYNTNTIKLIIRNSLKIYQESDYGGRFNQYYLIKIITENNFYSYGFKKQMYGDVTCKKYFYNKNKRIRNDFNDCGQLAILKNPKITEKDFSHKRFPDELANYRSIDLIPVLIEYADKIFTKNPNRYMFKFY